jgi:voltage-gated potassium channel
MTYEQAQLLSKVPLFANFSSHHLRRLVRTATEDHYDEGEVIVRGGRTETLFVILEGKAKILRHDEFVAYRSVGEFFGEIAVIDGRPRIGTVVAETPVRCLGSEVVSVGDHPSDG